MHYPTQEKKLLSVSSVFATCCSRNPFNCNPDRWLGSATEIITMRWLQRQQQERQQRSSSNVWPLEMELLGRLAFWYPTPAIHSQLYFIDLFPLFQLFFSPIIWFEFILGLMMFFLLLLMLGLCSNCFWQLQCQCYGWWTDCKSGPLGYCWYHPPLSVYICMYNCISIKCKINGYMRSFSFSTANVIYFHCSMGTSTIVWWMVKVERHNLVVKLYESSSSP